MKKPHPIAQALEAARIEQRLTLVDVARRVFVDRTTVRAWETGKSTPFLDNAAAWANALGMNLTLTLTEDH